MFVAEKAIGLLFIVDSCSKLEVGDSGFDSKSFVGIRI